MQIFANFFKRSPRLKEARLYTWIFLLFSAVLGCATPTTVIEAPLGNASEAVATEAVETETSPGDTGLTPELLYDLLVSGIAFQQGELEVATDALISAAKATDDPVVVARATRLAVHNKRYSEATQIGLRWIDLTPEDHQAYTITALAAIMDDQAETALEILNNLMDTSEQQRKLRFGQLAEILIQHAEGATLQQVCEELAEQYADISESWLLLAGVAQKHKDYAVMDRALDKILTLEPGNQKAAGYKLLALSDDLDAQLGFAQTFIVDYPQAFDFRMQYARLLLRKDREELALEELLQILKLDSRNEEAINLAALLYQSREEYANAAKHFKKRIELLPEDDRSRLYLANAYQQLQRYNEAKAVLATVSSQDELFNAGRQMTMVIEEADGTEKALVYLKTLIGNNQTERTQLIVDQQLLLQRMGRVEEAYLVLDEALGSQPDNDTLRYHRALINVERGDFVAHEADMRLLLEKKPDDPHYNNTLGYTLLELSDRMEEATILINRAYTAKPDDPYILDSKGWLEYRLGNPELGLEYLHKAFEKDQDAEIAAHIGEVYWVIGNQEKAREFWDKGDKIDPSNKSLLKIKSHFLNNQE